MPLSTPHQIQSKPASHCLKQASCGIRPLCQTVPNAVKCPKSHIIQIIPQSNFHILSPWTALHLLALYRILTSPAWTLPLDSFSLGAKLRFGKMPTMESNRHAVSVGWAPTPIQ